MSVSRTAAPSGGTKIKAVMVSLHRFYEGAGYASAYTEHARTTTFCADRTTTPVSVTASGPGYVDAPGTYTAAALNGGEGDVHLRVTVSSAGQSSTATAYIQKAISCGGSTAC